MMAMKQALFLYPWVLGCMGAAFMGVGCEGTRTLPTGTNTGQGDTATPCFSSTQCATGEICLLGLCTQGTLSQGNNPVTPPTCNCTGLQTCDDSTQECQSAAICTNDNDCVAPGVCARGQCKNPKPQCRFSDSECGPDNRCILDQMICIPKLCTVDDDCTDAGLVCNVIAGFPKLSFCVECFQQSHCPGNQTCAGTSCEVPSPCADDADCLGEDVCNASLTCEPRACASDTNEPANNDFVSPPKLSMVSSDTITGTTTDVCKSDTDIFAIENLNKGDGLLLRATYSQKAQGTPHAQLLETSTKSISNITDGAYGTLLVGVETVPSGTIYVKFTVTNGPIQLTFDIVTLPSGACFDDTLEPNSVTDEATLIEQPNPVGIKRTITNCPGDADWFQANVSAGKTLDVTVTTSSGTEPIVEIWPSALGNDPLKKDSSTTSPKILSVQNNSGAEQTYLIGLLLPPTASVAGSKVEVEFTTTGP